MLRTGAEPTVVSAVACTGSVSEESIETTLWMTVPFGRGDFTVTVMVIEE